MSDVTLQGLESWHRKLVEKFGWTVIAAAKGNAHKGQNFLQCLEHLINSIQLRLDGGIQSVDSHKDLEILLNNSRLLKEKAQLILNLDYNATKYSTTLKSLETPIYNISPSYSKSGQVKYGGKRSLRRK